METEITSYQLDNLWCGSLSYNGVNETEVHKTSLIAPVEDNILDTFNGRFEDANYATCTNAEALQ